MATRGSADPYDIPSTSWNQGQRRRATFPLLEESMQNLSLYDSAFLPVGRKEFTIAAGVKFLEDLTRTGHWLPALRVVDFLEDMSSFDGARALFIARSLRYNNAAKLLKHARADLRGTDAEGNTLLHKAIFSEMPKRAKALLQMEKRLLNRVNKHGYAALHIAVLMGSKNCLALLLESGANVNILTRLNQSALYICARGGDAVSMKTLLKAPNIKLNQDKGKRYNPLHVAAKCKKDECVRLLVAAGADVTERTAEGECLLHIFTKNGNIDLLQLVLDSCLGILNLKDARGHTPLYTAVVANNDECLKVLVEAGADVNVPGPDGASLLHTCAFFRYTKCLKVLIDGGANLEARTPDAHTPLSLAVEYNNIGCVQVLCDENVDVDAKDRDGWASLHRCAARGLVECAAVLIQAGADINTKDNELRTPLHIGAAYGGFYTAGDPVLRLLVESGALLDEQDVYGDTPLHIAIRQCNIDAVAVLVERGARKNVIEITGRTALHLALEMELTEVCKILEPETFREELEETFQEDPVVQDFYW